MATAANVVLQSERAECGLAAMTMIANSLGHDLDLDAMRRRFGDYRPTLASLLSIAASLQLAARPVRLGMTELGNLRLPALLHWEFDHFVVLVRVRRRTVVLHDPAAGRRTVDRTRLDRSFTGVAVEFCRAAEFDTVAARSAPTVWALLSSIAGLGRYLSIMLLLLFVTQVLALVPPVAMQLLIDEVVLGQDRRWLQRAIAGIALVMVAMLLIDTLRRRVALFTGMRLATDSTTLVVRQLLCWSPAEVERRAVGDLVSRVESLRPIRKALTETCLQAAVQCMILLTSLAVMAAYSGILTLLAVAALSVIAAMHAATMPRSRSLNLESVVAAAGAGNSLIDTLRGFNSVHALGLAPQRLLHWQKDFIAATNASTRQAGLGILANAGHGLVGIVEQALFLGIGIGGIVSKELTLGVLFAFISLRGRLTVATAELVRNARELWLVRAHVDRVAELLTEVREPVATALRRPLCGQIAWQGIGFCYPGGPDVLSAADGRVEAGESIVIRGPSGAGKSTLLRLLAGGLEADRGSLRYDGIEAVLWDPLALRRQFGVVLQSDRLFEGSIADNICCFDLAPDIGRLQEAATLACIWEELQSLPMNMHTQVGPGGSGLSGGQVQRLLLARALYRQPRILFLDEATSHLDPATERCVLDALRGLSITTICVAHRTQAVAMASRVIDLVPAQAVAIGRAPFHNAGSGAAATLQDEV